MNMYDFLIRKNTYLLDEANTENESIKIAVIFG